MKAKRSTLLFGIGILCFASPGAPAELPHATSTPSARVDGARIFPFFAAGGGWESTISLVNIGDEAMSYRVTFYASNGQPARVTFRDRSARITSADSIEGRLNDDGGDTFVLLDSGNLQTGWARLEYDGDNRISAVLVFRQRVSGRPDFEASVPLSRNDESRFWIPFDNSQGFATTLALTNPSSNDSTNVQLRFWDPDGREIFTRDIQLGANTTVSFSIAERYPELAGRTGQARAEASGGGLSSIALRFNPTGAFTTVPVASR